jgi:hypothetical protein
MFWNVAYRGGFRADGRPIYGVRSVQAATKAAAIEHVRGDGVHVLEACEAQTLRELEHLVEIAR